MNISYVSNLSLLKYYIVNEIIIIFDFMINNKENI